MCQELKLLYFGADTCCPDLTDGPKANQITIMPICLEPRPCQITPIAPARSSPSPLFSPITSDQAEMPNLEEPLVPPSTS